MQSSISAEKASAFEGSQRPRALPVYHFRYVFRLSARSLTIASTHSHSCGMASAAQVCDATAVQRCFMRDRKAAKDTPVSCANLRQCPDRIELIESLPPIFMAGADASAGQNTVETRS